MDLLNQKQKKEIADSIIKKSEIPMKFAYLGEGAKNWEAIAKNRSKDGIVALEYNLLKKMAEAFLNPFILKNINIIDLGCGDGKQAIPLLDCIIKQGGKFIYTPVDISQNLLNIAEKIIESKFLCKINKVLFDFESENIEIRKKIHSKGFSNLFCLFGNTVGNFPSINKILSNTKGLMKKNDFLLVGIESADLNNISGILAEYKGKLLERGLSFIPSQIGLNIDDYSFLTIWNNPKNCVEVWISLKKDINLKINEKNIKLKKNIKLLVCRSAKYNEWTFLKLFNDLGFRTEIFTTSNNKKYILIMVQS